MAKTPQGFLPRLLCGLDAAYHDDWGVGAAAVWDTAESRIVETFHVLGNVSVSYTPGLLGFREGPLILKAEKGLKAKPDAYLVDGHGIAHPRRFGLACHVGLAVGKPTIGVAKSGLFGSVEGNGVIGFGGEMLGVCLKTSTGRRYYVSVGHLIGLDDAVGIVSECMVGGFPAPLRAAHLESVRLRGLRR